MLLQRSKDEPWKCERSTATSRHDCSPWRNSYSHLLDDQMNSIGKNFWTELARIQAESFRSIRLDEYACLHIGIYDAVIQAEDVTSQWIDELCKCCLSL